jgi:hypothetical protein
LTMLDERFPEFMNIFSKGDRHTCAFASLVVLQQ